MPIAPILPLDTDPVYGVASYDLETGNARQNLLNLLLTIPGERIDVNYGVGLSQFLFLNSTNTTYETLKSKILSQVAKYMSEITIFSIDVEQMQTNENGISVKITFSVSGSEPVVVTAETI
jgi:phage baseplate assembly protein W